MTNWIVHLIPTAEVPSWGLQKNKKASQGISKNYAPPVLQLASKIRGSVVEVLSGDTVLVLAEGKDYITESDLQNMPPASIQAPRLGRTDGTLVNEPIVAVRVLTIGKPTGKAGLWNLVG
jgi:staphylococcal nuclease domain-containing protein 1